MLVEARLCDEAKEYPRRRHRMHEALHKLNSGEFCDVELGPSQPLAKLEQLQNTRPLHLHVSVCFEERGI